ncbi:MAG TPA: DUF1565 domain-containing protein [Desulfobulbus sp.]|nr:DUF1565 domain-containing protein [Desulfobulbus sp.]
MKPRNRPLQERSLPVPAAVLLLFFLICLPAISCAANIYVDDDTCPGTGSGTASNPYCSIGDAISAASSGDVVLVYPGTYDERIYMRTGVDVRSATATRPVITSTSKTIVKFNGVDNCTLDGFILDGSGGGFRTNVAMIRIYSGSNNITISNCEIKGADTPGASSFRTGIRINDQVDVSIIGNTIYNTDYGGITTRSGDTIYNSTVVIKGNTIEGHGRAGIYLAGRSGYSNRVIIGGSGVADGNIINNNGTGSAEEGSGIWLKDIDRLSIENNTIRNNRRAGIFLIDSSSVSPHVSGNMIHDNGTSGINIGGDSTLTIGGGNEIYNNSIAGVAFYVNNNPIVSKFPASQPVLITGNTIYGNGRAGVAVLDRITGLLTITANHIYQNSRSGITFTRDCTAVITDNDIHDHAGAAGIFTGDWSGYTEPDPDAPPSVVGFDRGHVPVNLTIRRNKIHDNLVGMRLDHASGVITNNLVYGNTRSGIRFSGDNASPYDPFAIKASWGITEISNNTVVDNGSGDTGGGIVYDDINTTTDPTTGSPRAFASPPIRNDTQAARVIKNNIAAFNNRAGIRDAVCGAARDYNLYYGNFGRLTSVPAQTGGCVQGSGPNFTGNPNEQFADPLFVDRAGGDYHLQASSPARNAGDDNNDLGAYGGTDPITW